jgi:hypothetical protein
MSKLLDNPEFVASLARAVDTRSYIAKLQAETESRTAEIDAETRRLQSMYDGEIKRLREITPMYASLVSGTPEVIREILRHLPDMPPDQIPRAFETVCRVVSDMLKPVARG